MTLRSMQTHVRHSDLLSLFLVIAQPQPHQYESARLTIRANDVSTACKMHLLVEWVDQSQR